MRGLGRQDKAAVKLGCRSTVGVPQSLGVPPCMSCKWIRQCMVRKRTRWYRGSPRDWTTPTGVARYKTEVIGKLGEMLSLQLS